MFSVGRYKDEEIIFVFLGLTLTFSFSYAVSSSAVDNYCGGKIPCYICAVENSDDTSTIQQCNLSQDNKNYLCPIHQTLCTATYQDPICPTGGNYNVNTKRCEANYSCPAGGAYNANTGKCEANPS